MGQTSRGLFPKLSGSSQRYVRRVLLSDIKKRFVVERSWLSPPVPHAAFSLPYSFQDIPLRKKPVLQRPRHSTDASEGRKRGKTKNGGGKRKNLRVGHPQRYEFIIKQRLRTKVPLFQDIVHSSSSSFTSSRSSLKSYANLFRSGRAQIKLLRDAKLCLVTMPLSLSTISHSFSRLQQRDGSYIMQQTSSTSTSFYRSLS